MLKLQTISDQDLPTIKEINDQVQPHPWSLADIQSEILRFCIFSKVAIYDGKTVGYIMIRPQGDDLEILTIGVSQDHQRKGIARALISDLIDFKPPASQVFLEVSRENLAAIRTYEKMGFETYNIRKAYYRDGTDALCMKLRLANP